MFVVIIFLLIWGFFVALPIAIAFYVIYMKIRNSEQRQNNDKKMILNELKKIQGNLSASNRPPREISPGNNDSRSNDSRSNDSRSNDSRSNDSRNNDPRSNDSGNNDSGGLFINGDTDKIKSNETCSAAFNNSRSSNFQNGINRTQVGIETVSENKNKLKTVESGLEKCSTDQITENKSELKTTFESQDFGSALEEKIDQTMNGSNDSAVPLPAIVEPERSSINSSAEQIPQTGQEDAPFIDEFLKEPVFTKESDPPKTLSETKNQPLKQETDSAPQRIPVAAVVKSAPIRFSKDPFSGKSGGDNTDNTGGRQTPQESKEVSRPATVLERFELLIGRKLLGWVSAGLFVLAALFFIQMVSSLGWLTLVNRIIGAFIAGGVFIAFGARYFQKEMPRFGAVLTCTGLVIIFLTAYYAKVRTVFSPEITTFILVAAVFGGFALADIYRSVSITVIAIVGGLAVPLLLGGDRDTATLACYLLLLNGAVIAVINRLEKTAVASLAFVGSLAVFFLAFPLKDISEIYSGLFFITGFWAIYFIDLFLAVFRKKRNVRKEDLLRVLTAPIILILGLYIVLCHKDVFWEEFNSVSSDLFYRYDGYLALFLFLLYGGVTWFMHQREKRIGTDPFSLSVVPMTAVVTFTSFAVMIPMLLTGSFIAIAWLASSVGLLYLYIRHDPKIFAVPTPQYRFWMIVFLILGLLRLYFVDLAPNLCSMIGFLNDRDKLLGDFLNSSMTIPMLHQQVLTATFSAILLIGGAFFVKRRLADKTSDGKIRSDAESLLRSETAVLFFINGVVIFLILAGTELSSFVSVLIYKSGRLEPAVWGWSVEHFVYIATAAAVYFIGLKRKKPQIRNAAQVLILLIVAKMIFLHLAAHPLLGGFALKGNLSDSGCMNGVPFELMNFNVVYGDHHIPLTGAYALTYAIISVFLFLFGRWEYLYCKRINQEESEQDRNDQDQSVLRRKICLKEKECGSLWMGTGAFLFWIIISLETVSYFTTRKELYPQTIFYSIHALWCLWLGIETLFFVGGFFMRIRSLRWLAYGLVMIQLPLVIGYEFLWNKEMPVFSLPIFNFDALPVILYSIFLMTTGTMVCRFGRDLFSKEERVFASCFGIAGIVICWLILTFDVFGYLCPDGIDATGREVRWKANLAVTTLWSVFAGVLLFIGFRLRSALLRWMAIGLFALTTMKVIFVDLAFIGQIYRVGAIAALALVLMFAAGAYQRFKPNAP